MIRCGVLPSTSGNVTAQDETVSLSVVNETVSPSSPFTNITAVICDQTHLPTHAGGLVDNALVYISSFVVRNVLKKVTCEECHPSLVTVAAATSFKQCYHLLELKDNDGVMIPSEGTVKVVRASD